MLKPSYTKQFHKDLNKIKSRGKDIEKIKSIMVNLINEIPLKESHHDHKLIGNFKGRRGCHIEPNWLLIYKLTNDEIIFERTGSHSDLFK